ncbi:pseudouridine synthase, partial [Carbonactinospora thermoautotrophica]
GRRPVEWPAAVLAGRQRDPGVTVVPALGLTLEEVTYPPDDQLAARALESRRLRTLSEG